jgi:hypothetical protein
MVQVLGLEPVAMPSAREYRRYTKLRKPFNVLADEFMVALTDDGDASDTTDRPALVALVQPCSFQGVTDVKADRHCNSYTCCSTFSRSGTNGPHGLSRCHGYINVQALTCVALASAHDVVQRLVQLPWQEALLQHCEVQRSGAMKSLSIAKRIRKFES